MECEVTGIVGIYSDPKHVILYTSNGEVRQEFSIVLTARPLGGQPTPSSESSEVHWVPEAELPGHTMDRSMRIRINDFLTRNQSPHRHTRGGVNAKPAAVRKNKKHQPERTRSFAPRAGGCAAECSGGRAPGLAPLSWDGERLRSSAWTSRPRPESGSALARVPCGPEARGGRRIADRLLRRRSSRRRPPLLQVGPPYRFVSPEQES
jgi:hypothetical protein